MDQHYKLWGWRAHKPSKEGLRAIVCGKPHLAKCLLLTALRALHILSRNRPFHENTQYVVAL